MAVLRSVPLVLLAAVVAFGCSEQNGPTASDSVVRAPSFDFTNGPPDPGNSVVVRTSGGFNFLTSVDPDRGLVARHYQADDAPFCGGGTPFPDWDFQDVSHPSPLKNVIKELAKASDIPLLIYPFFDGSKPFCDFLREDWIYRGTHTLINTDNNFFWFTGTGGTNSFGWMSEAFVWDQDGNRYRYNETQRIIVQGLCCSPFIDPEPEDFTRKVPVEAIKVHPIGNN